MIHGQASSNFDQHEDVLKHGKGLSCLDITGVYKNGHLFLLEAKNFKNRPISEHSSIIERLGSRKRSPVVEEVAGNMKDFVVFISFVMNNAGIEMDGIWETYKSLLFNKKAEIFCIFWLETSFNFDGLPKGWMYVYKAIMEDMLKEKLRWLTSDDKVFIASQHQNPFDPNLQVAFLQK